MDQIKLSAKFKIKSGNLEAFKQLIPAAILSVKENDPGTLTYEWYLNEELMECVALETYADSDALLAHIGNIGELLQKLMELADTSLEIYGNPSPALHEALQGLDTRIYASVGSL